MSSSIDFFFGWRRLRLSPAAPFSYRGFTINIKLELDREVLVRFPDVRVAGFLVGDLDRAAAKGEVKWQMVPLPADLTIENLANETRIARWREAFQAMDLRPSTYKSSVEQLVRRQLKGDSVQTPLPIVNLYCRVSAAKLAPLGGYDVERLPQKQIVVRFARPEADHFVPLTGRAEEMPLKSSVVVYASGTIVLCWALNHRDSKISCLRPETQVAVFLSEGVSMVHHQPLLEALASLRSQLQQLGATVGEIQLVNQVRLSAALIL